jgi:hypothetical protein
MRPFRKTFSVVPLSPYHLSRQLKPDPELESFSTTALIPADPNLLVFQSSAASCFRIDILLLVPSANSER